MTQPTIESVLRERRVFKPRAAFSRWAHIKSMKEYKKLVAAKKVDEAKAYLAQVYARADKTAKAGVIKKNRAARIKSRLARLLQ